MLYDYNKRRGIETTGIHRYRHTFAKQWIINGGNVVVLSQILGHSSLSITQNYINLLVYEICHAQFIIPTTVEVLEETGEDGRKKTRVGIPAIAKKDDPSVRIFPLFTDVREMVRWRGLAEGGQQLKVLPLNFKTAVSMMKNGYSAIGMNSFSNSSLVLSKEMITSSVNSEGYRREFS